MFGSEAEMKGPVSRWLAAQGMYVEEEFDTGWGVCDLVGCAFDDARIAHRTRQRQRQPLGSPEAILVYCELPDAAESSRGVGIAALAQRFAPYLGRCRIETMLDRLEAAGHVRRSRSGAYLRVNGWAPLHRRLVAVELKLQRRSDALEQAAANRGFAPESLVALPLETAERAAHGSFAGRLRERGIGLLGVDGGGCSLLISAKTPDALVEPHLALWATERFWSSYRGRH